MIRVSSETLTKDSFSPVSEKDSATRITRYRITEQDLVVSVSGKYDHIHNVERFLLHFASFCLLFFWGGRGGDLGRRVKRKEE